MKWKPNCTTGLLLVLLLMMGSLWWTVHGLHDGITRVIEQHESPMQTATSTVTNTNGTSITVVTVRTEDESTDGWLTRHNEAVIAAMNS